MRSVPGPDSQRNLHTELTQAGALLRRLDTPGLGRLLSTLLPAALVDELGPNGRVLLDLVSRELRRRESGR